MTQKPGLEAEARPGQAQAGYVGPACDFSKPEPV